EIEDQAEIEVITNPIPAKPVINHPDLVYMCDGNELDLITNVPDGITDVKWSTGSHSPSITVAREGKYSVTHTNTYNCSSLSSVNVQYPNAPYIRGNLSICEGDSSRLSVIGGDSWKWSTGEE